MRLTSSFALSHLLLLGVLALSVTVFLYIHLNPHIGKILPQELTR